MLYIPLALLLIALLDFLRSIVAVRKAVRAFRAYQEAKAKPGITFGKGKPFHVAILGDSTFDVRGDSKIMYGAAQVFVDELSRKYKVHVHMLAKAGAKSSDVIRSQLPELARLQHIDLVIVYMGANDAFRINNPFVVGKSYSALLKFTEKRKITVIASEIASYWHLSIFSFAHRILLYLVIHIMLRSGAQPLTVNT